MFSKNLSSNAPAPIYHCSIKYASKVLSHPNIIANPTIKNRTHNTFLNNPFGSEAHFNFAINFCPNNAIANIITDNPSTYANKFSIPTAKLAGKIIQRIIPYVGLQLENTGPSDIPTRILHLTQVLFADFARF